MIHHGPYAETLAQYTWDVALADPPFGRQTHEGSDAADYEGRRVLDYRYWTPRDVRKFVDFMVPRTRSWIGCFTSDDLAPAYRAAYKRHGLYHFPGVAIIQPRHRTTGDGPASAVCYLMLARPRTEGYFGGTWKPGYYYAPINRDSRMGGKPLSLMRELVRKYSRPGDIICDPCAGWGTTARAAQYEGRGFIGSEIDAEAVAVARARVESERPVAMAHAQREAQKRAIQEAAAAAQRDRLAGVVEAVAEQGQFDWSE